MSIKMKQLERRVEESEKKSEYFQKKYEEKLTNDKKQKRKIENWINEVKVNLDSGDTWYYRSFNDIFGFEQNNILDALFEFMSQNWIIQW